MKILLIEDDREAASYLIQALDEAGHVTHHATDGETGYVRDWLSDKGGRARAHTIPVYAFDSFAEAPERNLVERKDLIFVAGFGHAPNVDAAIWLVRDVLPRVRLQLPDIRLALVGSNPTDEVKALADEHVAVTGFVTDDELAVRYLGARVAVAPLRFGGGMKGKVIEAMRFGLPCVTTSIGAQGLEEADFLEVSDDPAAMAEKIVALVRDDTRWLDAVLFEGHGITDDFGEGGVISSMEAVAARLHPVLRPHCLDRDEFFGRKGM